MNYPINNFCFYYYRWMQLDQGNCTPVKPCPTPSPSRRKMLGSLERGLDKVRNMLTPKSAKIKKLMRPSYHGRKVIFKYHFN